MRNLSHINLVRLSFAAWSADPSHRRPRSGIADFGRSSYMRFILRKVCSILYPMQSNPPCQIDELKRKRKAEDVVNWCLESNRPIKARIYRKHYWA
jgi:hypothetical protein